MEKKTAKLESPTAPAFTSAKPAAKPRTRLTLQERTPAARNEIFAAAAKVVGEVGYVDATVSRITAAAGIAQGTFYLYFASRQTLFDELLLHVGRDVMDFIGGKIVDAKDVFDMEERALRAFFDYSSRNPGFFRILHEAEAAAPVAFQKHFKLLSKYYVASLKRGLISGDIRTFDQDELETVAYVLMAARDYLYMRFAQSKPKGRKMPEAVVQTYMKFLRNGLK